MNEKSKEYIKLDDKIHEIIKLANRVIEIKTVLERNFLTEEEKKPLYNRAWLLIKEINKVSKVNENESK